ncbi:MAG: cyclase family protein [Bacteroidetes bacterium]|nr:cyclase family protein [Bacteroidota bacterium]
MIVSFQINDRKAKADLNHPLDISIPLVEGTEQVNCFYAPLYETSPVVAGDFIGSTEQGGPLNFKNVRINPHGNGTHTECVGHIARKAWSINQQLKRFHFTAKLVSLYPRKLENGDRVILREDLEDSIKKNEVDAYVLRTLPNGSNKRTQNYSGSNPPYMEAAALEFLAEKGIKHLLLDLPSVDREEDEGKLAGHKAWWKYPNTESAGRADCTITELIYVPDHVPDGYYLLNIQIAPFEIDASPSKPILYPLRFEGD